MDANYELNTEQPDWQAVCEWLGDPMFLVTIQGTILKVNHAAERAAKRPRQDMVGRGICEIIHGGRLPHIECPLEEFLTTGQGRLMETRLPGLFGDYLLSIIPVNNAPHGPEHLCLIARELSSEEARQVEYHHTAHLAAIGELAAGVAHEINNPINGIINFAQILADETVDGQQRDILQRIIDEGGRIASITYKLLSFARGGPKQKELLCCRKLIEDTLDLTRHQLNLDAIQVHIDSAEELPLVLGNRHQLQQVFFNLISNSRYALNQKFPEPDGCKEITIACACQVVDQDQFLAVTVRDNGTGIPQGLLERIFDPFFSTKPPGAGTGLGLSISHGIIKEHNGFLRIDSVLHEYTRATVLLPVSDSPAARNEE